METTSFYNNLLQMYSRIKFHPQYDELSKLDKHIAYYLADNGDQFISARQESNNRLVELDIKSAFPTICRNLFGVESEFVKKMDSIIQKRERLIYIATTLKEAGDYLIQLNIMCKMIVLGTISELLPDDNFLILELKKDGILFTCSEQSLERLKTLMPIENSQRLVNMDYEKTYHLLPFNKYLIENKFLFHLTEYLFYYRVNKTSVFYNQKEEDIIIKGRYKYMPKKMKEIILKILALIHDELNEIREIYTPEYLKICQQNGLNEVLDNYYICDNDCVINSAGNYVKYNHTVHINPMVYLITFIYPPLLATKL